MYKHMQCKPNTAYHPKLTALKEHGSGSIILWENPFFSRGRETSPVVHTGVGHHKMYSWNNNVMTYKCNIFETCVHFSVHFIIMFSCNNMSQFNLKLQCFKEQDCFCRTLSIEICLVLAPSE